MSASDEGTGMPAADRPLCGKWMPRAKAHCGRKPLHPGKCITAKALKQQVDNRPRKSTRKRGVRLGDDPGVAARWRRAHKFVRLGITEEQFNQMLEAQGYACAICREPFGDQRICADHDHNCCPKVAKQTAKTCGKCIRGLLCVPCNTNLGWYELVGQSVDAYLAR
jgi:hypothetical protein